MEKEKQIEEMVKDIASTPIGTVKPDLTLTELGEVYKGEFISRIAKHLYNADYRKERQGEWIYPDNEFNLPKCSVCGMTSHDATYAHRGYYCPNCGASMTRGKTNE